MGCGASKAAAAGAPSRKSGTEEANRPPEAEEARVTLLDLNEDQPVVHDYFELGERIGKGTFGYCYRGVTKSNGVPVAIKSLLRKNKRFSTENVVQELEMLRRVEHPSCISVIAHFQDAEAVHIVTTLAPGGDLLDRLLQHGSMGDADTSYVIRQLMEALAYLHANNFVHRDVKPENILMMSSDKESPDFNRILLSDFGMAQQRANIHGNVLKTLIGTPEFSAPEVLAIARHGCTPGVPNSTHYSCAIDLWAAGCVTYTMLSSSTPFTSHKGTNVPGMIDRIMHGRYSFAAPSWGTVTPEAFDFIRRLLTVSPSKRITAPQALYHPFLSIDDNEYGPFSNRAEATGAGVKVPCRNAAMGNSSFATFARMAQTESGGVEDSWVSRNSPAMAVGSQRRMQGRSHSARSDASAVATQLSSPSYKMSSASPKIFAPKSPHFAPKSPHNAPKSPHGAPRSPHMPPPRSPTVSASGQSPMILSSSLASSLQVPSPPRAVKASSYHVERVESDASVDSKAITSAHVSSAQNSFDGKNGLAVTAGTPPPPNGMSGGGSGSGGKPPLSGSTSGRRKQSLSSPLAPLKLVVPAV